MVIHIFALCILTTVIGMKFLARAHGTLERCGREKHQSKVFGFSSSGSRELFYFFNIILK